MSDVTFCKPVDKLMKALVVVMVGVPIHFTLQCFNAFNAWL